MKKRDDPLHVSYIPRLITKRKEKILNDILKRFYNPYVFVLYILASLTETRCSYMSIVVPILIFVSSVHATSKKYNNYYKDLVYILESSDIVIDQFTKCHFILFELLLQLLATCVSFFWIKGVHTCTYFDTNGKTYAFFVLVIATLLLHLLNHEQTKKQTEHFVRTSYKHLNVTEI